MTRQHGGEAWLFVLALLVLTIALGMPLFHYVCAVLVHLALKHGRGGNGLLEPVKVAPRHEAMARLAGPEAASD